MFRNPHPFYAHPLCASSTFESLRFQLRFRSSFFNRFRGDLLAISLAFYSVKSCILLESEIITLRFAKRHLQVTNVHNAPFRRSWPCTGFIQVLKHLPELTGIISGFSLACLSIWANNCESPDLRPPKIIKAKASEHLPCEVLLPKKWRGGCTHVKWVPFVLLAFSPVLQFFLLHNWPFFPLKRSVLPKGA